MRIWLLVPAVWPCLAMCADWPQFRGINGSGVTTASNLPGELNPRTNLAWKMPVPPGHSSPVFVGNRIVLTGAEEGERKDAGRDKVVDAGKIYTICLDRATGRILWRKQAPRPRAERYQPTNSPVSPTPAIDGDRVYVFFGDFGLLAYRLSDGAELWRHPLGPFNNVNGHGSSPIVAGKAVVLLCDQDTDSYLLAVDKLSGKTMWKVERPEFTRSYSTPALLRPANGPPELIVPGAYQLTSYNADTGEKLWWVRGLSWQPKSIPLVHDGIVYAHWWEAGGEAGTPTETPPFSNLLSERDKDRDGRISVAEYSPDPKQQRALINSDLNNDGFLVEREWENQRARRASRNRLIAVRPGRGDRTNDVIWSMQKFLPNVPSPLLYEGVLYLVKDGGVLTAVNPANGEILKQGRLGDAIDTYYASPVAADGKLFLLSQHGKAVVVKAGPSWEVLSVTDLEEECYATPAISGDRVYVRTRSHLFSFKAK